MEAVLKIEQELPTGLFYNLNERQRRVYQSLVCGIIQMKSEIITPFCSMDELTFVQVAIFYDYPELGVIWCYRRSRYSIREVNEGQRELVVYMQYQDNKKGLEKRIAELERKAEEILEKSIGRDTGSDAEAVKSVCNYIRRHYRYSAQMPNGEYPEYAYSVECLLRRDGVCSGFASGLTYLLRKLQIPVITVLGKADGGTYGRHAWNIVKYADGSCRHIDVTWDMGREFENSKFFNIDDWAMRARRHFWCEKEYPVCGNVIKGE